MKKTDLTGLEIAIIGYSGKFNNCSDVHTYWEKLCNGEETFRVFTDEELRESGVPEKIYKDQHYVPVKGSLIDAECFDPRFFGYTPDEASIMDPQIRSFHEMVWSGLEMAGYHPAKTGKRIGLYATASDNPMWQVMMALRDKAKNGLTETDYLSNIAYLCSLISYKLNLKGPAVFTQTACSSSLVTVHLAARALLTGDCDIAVAGGISSSLLDTGGYLFQENSIYSPDGHCRAFDSQANGTLKGEGGGVVILKKYQDAIRDNDTIHAVIKGSALNNDGSEKLGFTAPGINGQKKVIKNAIRIANVDPDSVSYIETHGTGTRLGDPVEFKALTDAYEQTKMNVTPIGSVKSNIGHTDVSAGIASLLKVILMIKNRKIPPSLHFKDPNPAIDFKGSSFYVNDRLQEWSTGFEKLRAGISSFGIGGTNCHIIVEEHIDLQEVCVNDQEDHTINLSAPSGDKLKEMVAGLVAYLKENKAVKLADLSYTLNCGRADFPYRRSIVAHSIEGLIDRIGNDPSGRMRVNDKAQDRKVVFVFSGQGSQYPEMARGLYEKYPLFRSQMNECFSLIKKHHNITLGDILYGVGEVGDERIHETVYAQLAIFSISYSMAMMLIQLGIKPSAAIGHSIGEYAGAVVSGMLSLDEAIQIIGQRGSLMQQAPKGRMYIVFADEDTLKALMPDEISIAAINADNLVVISGSDMATDAFLPVLSEKGIVYKKMHTSHAFHSSMMESVLPEYASFLNAFTFREMTIPLISNITGIFFETAVDGDYWCKHLRQTVRFGDGIKTLLADGYHTFIEVGPGNQLIKIIDGMTRTGEVHLVNIIKSPGDRSKDPLYFINKLSLLWQTGWTIPWDKLYEVRDGKRIPLPAYPFDRTRFPLQVRPADLIRGINTGPLHPVGRFDVDGWLFRTGWKQQAPDQFETPEKSGQGSVLVFCDEYGYAGKICEGLIERGQDLISIELGDGYRRINDRSYILDACDPEGYNALMSDIRMTGRDVKAIVHCFDLDSDSSFEDILHTGYLSLSFLAQSLQANGYVNDIHLTVLAEGVARVGAADRIEPAKAMALGALKVISVEYDNLLSKFIDVRTADLENPDLLSSLTDDLFSNDGRLFVAYRGPERYVQTIEPVKTTGISKNPLRRDGCYVVTGGLGGMGLSIAQDIAARERARLALISRRKFPKKDLWDKWLQEHHESDATSGMIRRLKAIELKGSEVMVISADVADFMQMKNAVARIGREFGRINGIIWAAGVIDYDGVIQRRSRDQFITNIRSKVHGLLIAEQLINLKELDFMVLFSSMGNLYYNEKFGQVAYNVANEFLDAYSQAFSDSPQIITLNWCDWKEAGMTMDGISRKDKQMDGAGITEFLKTGLTVEEGVKSFWKCVEIQEKNCIISKIDLVKEFDFRRKTVGKYYEAENRSGAVVFDRPDLNTPFREPGKPTEIFLAALCSRLFGISSVGVDDDFLELGGDSLKAAHYINQIKKEMKVKLTLEDFFVHPTIALLAGLIDSKPGHPRAGNLKVADRQIEDACRLLPAQNRIFISDKLQPGLTNYNQVFIFKTDPIGPEKLYDCARKLISMHQALRAYFILIDSVPVQKFSAQVEPEILRYIISEDSELKQVQNQFERSFDLSRPPLFRIGYVQNTKGRDYLIVDIHHIISDGISNQVFLNDLSNLLDGKPVTPVSQHFKSYVEWFNSAEVREEIEQGRQYWLDRFKDYSPARGLPLDYPRKPEDTKEGGRYKLVIPAELTRQLNESARKAGVTLFAYNLAVLNILLYKLTNDSDIVIGGTHFGRDFVGFEKVMGMFIETIALRNKVTRDMTFSDFLMQVRVNTYRDFDHRKYPFEELVDKLGLPKSRGRNPLFDVVLSSDNIGFDNSAVNPDNKNNLEHVERSRIRSSFEILVTFSAHEDVLSYCFEYNTNLFKGETIMAYGEFYQEILSQVINRPEIRIGEIFIERGLSYTARQFSGEVTDSDGSGHILTRIMRVSEERRAEPALVIDNHRMTYGELMSEVNKLAACLTSRFDILPGDKVAVYLERSESLIIALLAIIKARGVFVPVDISTPEKRIRYILEHSDSKVMITVSDSLFAFPYFTGGVFAMDIQLSSLDEAEGGHFSGKPDDLAYILFTSGSTGHPKGVKVSHRSLSNYIGWANRYYFNDNKEYGLPMFTSISFDFTLTSIFSPLTRGGEVHIYRDDMDVYQALGHIFHSDSRAIKITPAHIDVLDSLHVQESAMEIAIVGGEALLPHHVAILRKMNPGIRVFNEYGPTEATVACSAALIAESDDVITIGRPIDNARIYIVDDNMRLLPPQVPGELLIAGMCLSSGYTDEKESNEKFLSISIDGSIVNVYKSGDRGLYNSEGNIVFLGRMQENEQVKIRGYRIELKEIENVFSGIDKVDRAIVVVRVLNGEDMLVAYYLSKEKLDERKVRAHLERYLPKQMIPGVIMRLDAFPLNTNGKVDYRALPAAVISRTGSYIPPANELEEKMVEIWSVVLGVEKGNIGLNDSFFNLGGNSLKVIQLSQKIENEFEVSIPVAVLFDLDSIHSIVAGFFHKPAEKEIFRAERL